MKHIVAGFAALVFLTSFGPKDKYVDPTGTYALRAKTTKRNGLIYGYTGQIQVKKFGTNQIVMTFYVSKGEPSYNSGSFVDTLVYAGNKAIYRIPELDTTCKITFEFDRKSVRVKEETADFNCGCGFGHAVVADGYYRKISKKSPVLREPLTDMPLGK